MRSFINAIINGFLTLIGFVIIYIPTYIVGLLWTMMKDGWKDGKNFDFLS